MILLVNNNEEDNQRDKDSVYLSTQIIIFDKLWNRNVH